MPCMPHSRYAAGPDIIDVGARYGARNQIRTDDTRFRRAVLYPLSYPGNMLYCTRARAWG